MNDRYLFKAKRIDNGEWEIGSLTALPNGDYEIENKCKNPPDSDPMWSKCVITHKVDPTTLCQCTGWKDKNKSLIWENDVVRFQFDNDDCPFPNKDTKKRIGKVFFSDYRASWSVAMGIKGSKNLNDDLFKFVQCGNRIEVIGNIFDNPELLGGWSDE